MNLRQEINKRAETAERIALLILDDPSKTAQAMPLLHQLNHEIDRLRNQEAWNNRASAWTYPQEPSWTN